METSALYNQIDAFTQEDNCLFFALGLAHAASQMDRKSLNSSLMRPTEAGPAPSSEEDDLLFLFLGVISFSRYYLDVLKRFNAGYAPLEPPALSVPARPEAQVLSLPVIRQLLR